MHGHIVAYFKVFCFSSVRFDGHNVTAILGPQRSFPLGLADADDHRDHPPAISHDPGYGLQVAGLLVRDCHEEPGGGAFPEPDPAVELDVHWYDISDAIPGTGSTFSIKQSAACIC